MKLRRIIDRIRIDLGEIQRHGEVFHMYLFWGRWWFYRSLDRFHFIIEYLKI